MGKESDVKMFEWLRREMLAAVAMHAILSASLLTDPEEVSDAAYAMADAIIKKGGPVGDVSVADLF